MQLADRLQGHADVLIAEASETIDQARLHHYAAVGTEVTQDRLRQLLAVVIESLQNNTPMSMIDHAERVAVDRFHAGVGIEEIQVAFNALEEALWRFLLHESPTDELADDLGWVGSVLGEGKDHLARNYVRLASREHHPSVDVQALNEIV
jgi:hypothetical protein